jgi:hypothetical protein
VSNALIVHQPVNDDNFEFYSTSGPDVISNIMLWEKTGEKPIELQIKKR